jgi:hypothetical protein
MEGNMRGPSSQDCEKSFARAGLLSANMILKNASRAKPTLVQVDGLRQPQDSPLSRIIDYESNLSPQRHRGTEKAETRN